MPLPGSRPIVRATALANRQIGFSGQPVDVGRAAAGRLVAVGLDCAGALAAVGPRPEVGGPPALSGFVAGRHLHFGWAILHWLRIAPSGHKRRLGGALVLSGFLYPGVHWFGARRRPSAGSLAVVAAPVVWTGLELAKGHLLSGFTMGSLAHSQYRWLAVIQIADVIGCYGVSGVLMFVAACVARMIPWQGRRAAIWPRAAAGRSDGRRVALWVQATAAQPASDASNRRNAARSARVALIQGAIDTQMKSDPGQAQRIYDDYMRLSRRAVAEAAASKSPVGRWI